MSKRKHVPTLDTARLAAALDGLARVPIPGPARQQIEAILRAAQNPDAESPAVVIASLPAARRENVARTERAVGRLMRRVWQRAARELDAIPDDEWDRLVEAARDES